MSGFRSFMDVALVEARAAALRGEVPVGAVVVSPDGVVVAQAGNRTRELCDPTARQAARIASTSAWAVGSHISRVRFPACATTTPSGDTTTAPTGTSPRSAAARASANAASMNDRNPLIHAPCCKTPPHSTRFFFV